jgi:predicted acylesterase/phospholipase RssA
MNTSIVFSRVTSVVICPLSAACAGHRPPRSQPELMELRAREDARFAEFGPSVRRRLVERLKARYDQNPNEPLVADMLIISGGGDWGAFGAGFLKGWSRVHGPLAKPEFDVVTGVSTGALISPFAFLGDDDSIDLIETLYRNPKKDWVKKRLPLYFLPGNQSFATVPGLERELRERVDISLIRRVAEASKAGRLLAVNTTDVDDGGLHVWDVGSEAQRAAETGEVNRVHQILLASSGIPGAFPFREIDGSLYVDGGVTGNILYAGGTREDQNLVAVWAGTYPNLPLPRVRYWVIFNNQLRPLPQVTSPTWVGVVSRSVEMGTRSATITALRHLFAQAEISRLKRGGTVEVRVVAVPNDFVPPKPGTFMKETMNALADLGETMGADPSSWMMEPP